MALPATTPVITEDAVVTNLTPAIVTTTAVTTLKKLKTILAVKPKIAVPSTSTGITDKMTGKTSGPAKGTESKKKIQILIIIIHSRTWKIWF